MGTDGDSFVEGKVERHQLGPPLRGHLVAVRAVETQLSQLTQGDRQLCAPGNAHVFCVRD